MATIADLTELTTPASGDFVAVRDVSDASNKDKKMALNKLGVLSLAATWTAVQTFSSGFAIGHETFNYYDIGTWTPVAAGATLSAASGFYGRYGAWCFGTAIVTWPTTSDTTSISLTGLPFTPNTSSAFQNGGFITRTDYGSGFAISIDNAQVRFRPYTDAAGLTNANLSGKTVRFAFFYLVA